jgi:hypothetical protein
MFAMSVQKHSDNVAIVTSMSRLAIPTLHLKLSLRNPASSLSDVVAFAITPLCMSPSLLLMRWSKFARKTEYNQDQDDEKTVFFCQIFSL